jgi:hypothetical protein
MERSTVIRVALLSIAAGFVSCAGNIARPTLVPDAKRDALLVLTGFGYGRAGARTLRTIQPRMAAEGIDLYVPPYLARGGLQTSRSALLDLVATYRLDQYERLHVFAFLAGAWTMNPAIDGLPPNLATVVYDRSPLQERAPTIAVEYLRLFAWFRYGSTIFDVARTPYPRIDAPGVKIALLVESTPTAFIRRHERAARGMGAFDFECHSFGQRHDDCGYVDFSHDELYEHFDKVWPQLLAFIRTGRFTNEMNRTPPAGDPFSRRRS